MKLFSKFKNQNDDLEAILINKTFSTFIKNLLLSMIYKIEISYDDYSEVRQINKTSQEIIYEINKTIEKHCDFIQLADPNDNILEKNKVLGLVNLQERSIFSYPTEVALLYSILSIMPKYYYIKDEYVFKNLIQSSLVDGFIANTIEIIQDFNGWTWDNSPKPNSQFISHLIYYNLIEICGEEYLTKWRNDSSPRTDYIAGLKKKIEKIDPYNKFFLTLEKLLFKMAPDTVQVNYTPKLNRFVQEYNSMQDKSAYLGNCKKQIQVINKEINKIDILLTNPRLLNYDFQKNGPMNRIYDINKYAKMLVMRKNNYLAQISNIMKMQNPIEFMKRKMHLEHVVEVYQSEETKDELLVKLELEYIKLLKEQIKSIKNNDDILKMIHKIRYFKKINISNKKKIENISKINKELEKCYFEVIDKACVNGLLRVFSLDVDYNFEIYKIIFDTKIIDLKETNIKLLLEDKEYLMINVYDKDVFETKKQLKYNKEVHAIQTKTNRLLKIFL